MFAEIAHAGRAALAGLRNLPKWRAPKKLVEVLEVEPLVQASAPKPPAQRQDYLRDFRNAPNAEKIVNQAVTISSISLTFALIGTFIYWPVALLSVPYMFYQLWLLARETYYGLKRGKLHISSLTAFTIATCIVMGYVIPANLIGFVVSVSRKYVMKVKNDTEKDFIDIFKQHPKSVWMLVDQTEVEVPFEALKVGDVVIVHPGEMIPVDGTITEGMASVDQRILTGEAQPVEKEVGDQVFASTIVLNGKILIRMEKAGVDTIVAQIGVILNKTVNVKSDMQLKSEELADRTVIPFLIAGGLTLPILGPMAAVSVINSHIGYRMSVVGPIGVLSFFRILSTKGILVKDGRVLDLLSTVDTVVFDKTGTLTLEQPHVKASHLCSDYTADELLIYAATAEGKQRHPIALAIVEEARARQLNLRKIDDAHYEMGYGLTVTIAQRRVRVGSHRFIEKEGIAIPATIHAVQTSCHEQGHSLVLIAIDDALAGAIELQPTVRPEAATMVKGLRERGIKATYIISGDHETPTRKLANELGIDHFFAQVLPHQKAELIEQLQNEGKVVCYIGDGINDSIALKKAHVSISLSGASTVAQDTAQIIMLNGGLQELCDLFDIGKEFAVNTRNNFWAVVGPCVLCIGGVYFASFGLVTTIVLKQLGLFTGIASALSPLRAHRNELVLSRKQPTNV